MSTEIKKDIVCPACGQTQKLEMYTSVNAEENPELRRDILRESIFDWECRHCGYTAQMPAALGRGFEGGADPRCARAHKAQR